LNIETKTSKVRQVLPKVIWEEPCHHHSQQKMDSAAACATICAMPSAHCRRVQSLSHKYITYTMHRWTHVNNIYCTKFSCRLA